MEEWGWWRMEATDVRQRTSRVSASRAEPAETCAHEKDLTWSEVHHELLPMMHADDRASVLCIAREYASLTLALAAGAWGLSALHAGSLSLALAVPVVVLLAAVIAAVQHRLSGLAHEASHSRLFRNRLVNELASDLLLLFPILAVTSKYRAAHLGHHRYVNDPARDPDWQRLAEFEPMDFPKSKPRFWVRYVLRGLWPPAILRYLLGRARAANLTQSPSGELELREVYRGRVARSLRGAYWLTVLTVIHLYNYWLVFVLFWVLPLLTFYPFFMLLREIAHHANAPDDGLYTNSRIFEMNPILAWAVFPYGQDFHLTHHLFAGIPHHRIREAHRLLQRYRPYRERVTVCRGYFWRRGSEGQSVLDILAARPGFSNRPARESGVA